MRNLLRCSLLAVVGVGLASSAVAAQERTNPFAASMAGFQMRVKAYLDLRSSVTKSVPDVKETGDPAKISAREQALGKAIAAVRKDAKAGDVFGDLTPYLQRILADDWKKRKPAERQALFDEIPDGLMLGINRPYPTTIPLVTAPARLLAALPVLPEVLEYRLVDRRLLLRDRDANIIVDVLVSVPSTGSR